MTNAVLPPKALRNPADMKRPALLAAGWQVHKVLTPIIDAGTKGAVRSFENARQRRGSGLVAAAWTNTLVLSLAAAVVAKEVARPVARRAVQIADAMPAMVKSAAASLTHAADAMVLKADKAMRGVAR